MAVEFVCTMPNNSKTTVGRAKSPVLKILKLFSDLFDNLVNQFQVYLQDFALNVSPGVTSKRVEVGEDLQRTLRKIFSASQRISTSQTKGVSLVSPSNGLSELSYPSKTYP